MSMTVKLPDELINQLSEFDSHTEEIISESLKAGAKITEQQVKANLKSVIGVGTKKQSRSSGQLYAALGVSPVKQTANGWDLKIGFAEPRRNGQSNAKVASILEYGSIKHNQAAKPFMKPAKDASAKAAKAAIVSKFDELANKYLKSKG